MDVFLRVNEDDDKHRPFWLTVPHVCRQWRALALSVSALWCEVSLFDHFISKMFFERCKFGPLYVHQSYSRVGYTSLEAEQGLQGILEPHTSRMHTINLYGSDAITLWSSLRCFRGPFLSLESLSLSSGAVARLPWTQPTDDSFPALCHLKLYRVVIPWMSPIFRNLQTLKLHDQLVSRRSCTMQDFVQVLEQCSHSLLLLSIAFSGPRLLRDSATYPSLGRTVHLSQLQKFDIHHHAIDIAHILAHVTFPNGAQLTIRYEALDGVPLDRCFPRDNTVFTHLTNISTFKFQGNSSSAEIECDNFALFASIDEEVNPDDNEMPDRVSAFLAQSISRICTPHTVKEVTIECMWVVTVFENDWFQALSRLSSLNTLSFYQYQEGSWSPFGLCAALVREKEDGSFVCPQLQRLVLEDLYFTLQGGRYLVYPQEGQPALEWDPYMKYDVAEELVECLTARALRGSTLQTLTIHRAHELMEATMPLLEEIVGHLEWDVYKDPIYLPVEPSRPRFEYITVPDSPPSDSPPSSP